MAITRTAILKTSRYGTARPTLLVDGFERHEYRALRAELFCVASALETTSERVGAQWVVVVEDQGVALELVEGSKRESDAAMAVLRGLAVAS